MKKKVSETNMKRTIKGNPGKGKSEKGQFRTRKILQRSVLESENPREEETKYMEKENSGKRKSEGGQFLT